jgi:hypothetical protein
VQHGVAVDPILSIGFPAITKLVEDNPFLGEGKEVGIHYFL